MKLCEQQSSSNRKKIVCKWRHVRNRAHICVAQRKQQILPFFLGCGQKNTKEGLEVHVAISTHLGQEVLAIDSKL